MLLSVKPFSYVTLTGRWIFFHDGYHYGEVNVTIMSGRQSHRDEKAKKSHPFGTSLIHDECASTNEKDAIE